MDDESGDDNRDVTCLRSDMLLSLKSVCVYSWHLSGIHIH